MSSQYFDPDPWYDEASYTQADADAKAEEIRADPYYSGDDYAMFGDAE